MSIRKLEDHLGEDVYHVEIIGTKLTGISVKIFDRDMNEYMSDDCKDSIDEAFTSAYENYVKNNTSNCGEFEIGQAVTTTSDTQYGEMFIIVNISEEDNEVVYKLKKVANNEKLQNDVHISKTDNKANLYSYTEDELLKWEEYEDEMKFF